MKNAELITLSPQRQRVYDKLHPNSKREHRTRKKRKGGVSIKMRSISLSLFFLCAKQTK
jgi:hypothetical protein